MRPSSPSLARTAGQRLALHVLHRDEEAVVDRSELEDLDQVRVRQQAAQLGLVDEHPHERPILRQMREHPLDHHRALETLRPHRDGEEHLRHAAGADSLEQVVLAERLRAGERRQISLSPHAHHRKTLSAGGLRLCTGPMRSVGPAPTRSHLRPHRARPTPGPHSSMPAPRSSYWRLKSPPLVQDHVLDLIDSEIAPLELQPVRTAGTGQPDDRRLLAGIGAVDPELRPRVRADGDASTGRAHRWPRARARRAAGVLAAAAPPCDRARVDARRPPAACGPGRAGLFRRRWRRGGSGRFRIACRRRRARGAAGAGIFGRVRRRFPRGRGFRRGRRRGRRRRRRWRPARALASAPSRPAPPRRRRRARARPQPRPPRIAGGRARSGWSARATRAGS